MQNSVLLDILTTCTLFRDLTRDEIARLCAQAHPTVRDYARESVLAFEEDECHAVGVLVRGSIHIQRIYPNGKSITIETIRPGESFGEALIFANAGVYPATLFAAEDCQVIFVSKTDVLNMLSLSPRFLNNFLRSLSNRILLLNQRIKALSFTTVRQKVAHALLGMRRERDSDDLILAYSRQEWADALAIPRPSLSRELMAMKEAGWIDFERKNIAILNAAALEACLSE